MTTSNNSEIVFYSSENGDLNIQVHFENDNVWLTQAELAELYHISKSTISYHIANIFEKAEQNPEQVVRKIRTTASDGKIYNTAFYNLDMIIALGYRIDSEIAIRFRKWATERLHEYIQKGFTMDDERLKNLSSGNYFKELLERIRDIRTSEKVFYRQILDIYATSIDYDPKSTEAQEFFKKVQNKIHFAVHGETAPETIYNRANSEKEFMGLTTFSGSRPYLKDVEIAKNYLTEKELRAMNQIVSGYLDFAERKAENEEYMTMQDWSNHLDAILTSTGEKLLEGGGKVSREVALKKAHSEYKKYQQKTLSNVEEDFLNNIERLNKKLNKKN